ncbi:hypothetical protein BJV78DRAFT_1207869 [Lactifluus subvellereus]|nr:hypothetical protein BJV78DRAFT_1207869 [Lactifluus subvellereus]
MAPLTVALLALLTASLASAGPVALDNATLLLNGQQAQILNCEFQRLQTSDPCNTGETACIQNALAFCVNNAWQTQLCPSSKTCFALPQIRANGTFVACTSQNNAASIIAAAGANATSDCTGGDPGSSSSSGSAITTVTVTVTVAQAASTVLTLPPTTTTLSPDQASSLVSSLSANGLSSPVPSVPALSAANANSIAVIQLTSHPLSSVALTPAPTPSSTAIPANGGYPY